MLPAGRIPKVLLQGGTFVVLQQKEGLLSWSEEARV